MYELELDKKKDQKQFKSLISRLCIEKGWSRTDLAREAGLAPQTVYNFFSKDNWQPKVAAQLSGVFNLFGEKN
jgi:lambda repressor-like predicted transcriptional regulator